MSEATDRRAATAGTHTLSVPRPESTRTHTNKQRIILSLLPLLEFDSRCCLAHAHSHLTVAAPTSPKRKLVDLGDTLEKQIKRVKDLQLQLQLQMWKQGIVRAVSNVLYFFFFIPCTPFTSRLLDFHP